MSTQTFKALVVRENANGKFLMELCDRSIEELPPGELLIRVAYSSLNYKDALCASGNKGITRKFPHTPGIDAAGTVEESQDSRFSPGDKVIVTSFDLGMNTDGGFSELIRVPADWAVMLPSGLGMRESMILGTAGLTAAISHEILRDHDLDERGGPILVTGASGGVGSISVALLSTLGFEVIALTGKEEAGTFLEGLGASQVLKRDEFLELKDRPLMKSSFQGVV
ncbi:alcohol dehydrogenase catalytic domain-containing protein, partial [bacterium]|nr:alcohol dehydrogenase catalytic domain-containing protein [bacterium]